MFRRASLVVVVSLSMLACAVDKSGIGSGDRPDAVVTPPDSGVVPRDSAAGDSSASADGGRTDAEPVDARPLDAADGCSPGSTRPCTVGACDGTETCSAARDWDLCALPTETCNGVDDDCDGTVDNDGSADCASATGCVVARRSGSVYLFCDLPRGWDEAQAHCSMFGYDLVLVGSDGERDFLIATANGINDNEWWLGLRDMDSDGSYEDDEWVRGSTPYRYWNFFTDPDSIGQCAMFEPDEDSGRWRDRDCSSSYRFICEAR